MHIASQGAASCYGSSSWSSSSSGKSSSSGNSSSSLGARSTLLRANAAALSRHNLPKDPPSAYHVLRQQLAHSSSSSSSQQEQQPAGAKRQQSWPRPVDDVCKAVSRRLKQAGSAAAVLQVVQHHAAQFNAVNTALAYAQLARHLRFETSSSRSAVLQHSSYLSLQGLAVQQAAVLNPRQVSMVLTSLAWMQCPAEEAVAPAGNAWNAPQHSSSTMQQQAAAADGTALRSNSNSGSGMVASPAGEHQKAEQQPQVVLLGLLSQRLHVLLDSFEPEDTCHCLWALSKLSALQPDLLAAVTAHGLSHDWLHSLTAKPLSSLLWVHAQAHLQRQQAMDAVLRPLPQHHFAPAYDTQGHLVSQLVAAVMHEVSQPGFLATWTPQELSMLLWCCTVLGVPLEQQQEAVAVAAVQTQRTESEQQLQWQQGVGAVTGVTAGPDAAAQLPVSVLQQVCQMACQHVVQFTPQGIAMVCWSVAQLVSSAALAGAAPSQQQAWHASHPVLAVLPQQLHQPVTALFEAFAAAAASRLHYYKPQEVCNIFTACCRLQLLPLALKQTVESYISSHTHLLGCRDVTDLLLAAAQLQQQRRGQHRSGAALGPVSVRALLHRTGQLLPELSGFQCGAAAWACVRLAELQESAYSSPSGGSGSNRGRVPSSSGSTLQEECMATASSLLDCLDRQLAEAAAGIGEVSTAVDSPAVASLVQHSRSGRAQAGSVLENAGDLKQAVALSWALAAASSTSSTHSWGPSEHAGDSTQHGSQHSMLLASVLQELQQGVQGCDASSMVQALCVLVRLHPVLSTSCAADSQQAGQQVAANSAQQVLVQQLHATAMARLLPLVPQLSPAEAATAAWAVVKLQVLQQQRHTPSIGKECAGSRSSAVSLLSTVLEQLHHQQQLSSLAGHSVASLLWCCRAMGWVPRAAVYCQLLAAADANLLQLQPQQQVVVLQAAAAIAGARMVPWQAQHVALDLRQLQRQQARLLHGAMEQLQATLQQQASQLDLQLNSPRAAGLRGHPASTGASQHAAGCGPEDLISLVAACRSLQLQGGPLLQQVCEVWQLLLQQGAVSIHQVLRMVWHLADVLQDSPAEPWHAAILRQQQQLPGSPITLGQGSLLLPQLLHHAVAALSAQLAAVGSSLQQGHHHSGVLSPHTLALAVRVFAKLRYQPPAQVLAAVLQQLRAVLHLLPGHDAVAVLSAAAQLALPVPQLATAVASELHGRGRAPQHMRIAGAAVGQWQHQQTGREAGSNSTHSAEPLMLLWSVLCSEVVTGGNSSSVADGQHKRVLARLAREAAGLPQEQLLQKPHLALMAQQVWRMLHQLQDFTHLHRASGLAVSKLLLPQQFRSMSQVLLPSSMVGPARQQALLQLLCADQQQQKAIVCQRVHAALQEQSMSDRPVMSMQHMAQLFSNLLPLWLQYQLQKHCQEQLARELVKAQVAAGFAAAGVRLRILPSGEVVLVLQPQQPARRNPQQRRLQCQWLLALRMRSKQRPQQQRLAAQTGMLSSGPVGAGRSSQRRCKGVAVVLETPNNLAVNTGQLLGSARVRDALLQAEGYRVLSLPLQCWLPEFVLQHQHSMQLQAQQEQPGRQLHVQKLQWKKLNRLQKKRKQQVQQLLEALYFCSRHSGA